MSGEQTPAFMGLSTPKKMSSFGKRSMTLAKLKKGTPFDQATRTIGYVKDKHMQFIRKRTSLLEDSRPQTASQPVLMNKAKRANTSHQHRRVNLQTRLQQQNVIGQPMEVYE